MRLRLSIVLVVAVGMCACSKPPQDTLQASAETAPEVRIQQIPPADPQKYGQVRDMKSWRNPYLIVKQDGLWLLDVGNNEERPVNPDRVLDALATLPDSAWPYGRVVAVQEIATGSSDSDHAALRRNRAVLAGTLEGAHVLINWVPGS
jgi:hypothetical protein